jgi:ABC-2 type transport system ATP-binding protein
MFLDEPTAGVDVELRQGMWRTVEDLRQAGVTIILTTHYIEEAEEIADRVAVIHKGQIIVVEEKAELMRKLGKKSLVLDLLEPLNVMPPSLEPFDLELSPDRQQLIYSYDSQANRTGITVLISALGDAGIRFRDLHTSQSSLEDIFVDLVRDKS